jgi:hypothetical protein
VAAENEQCVCKCGIRQSPLVKVLWQEKGKKGSRKKIEMEAE